MVVDRPSLAARSGLLILALLLMGAFGLRLWDLNAPSIWHDEAWSIRAIRDPVHTPDDNTPPAYYSLMHLLWRGAGETPLALRYGSVLLDLITVAVGAGLIRRWAGWNAALLTAALLGLSPLLWAYAREVRAYVAVPLLTLLLLWGADRLLQSRDRLNRRAWGGLLLAELLLLYTHNLSVPVIAWLNVVVGATWLWRRAWRWIGFWLAGQAALLVVYLPWLAGQSPSGTALNTPPDLRPRLLWDIWQAYFAPVPAQLNNENALVLGSALFGAVALVAVGLIGLRCRNRHTLLLLSQAVLLPALATAELWAAHINFHPRYYVAGVPAALALIALGLESLPVALDLRRVAASAVLALATGTAASSITGVLDKYRHDDFHALAEYYAALPADAIILVPYGWEPALEEYYVEKMGIQAEILGIELHSDAAAAAHALNAALAERARTTHIELLTWYQLPADIRGMYPCLLEAAGRLEGDGLTVQGIRTQGYRLERPIEWAEIPGAAADYGPVSLIGAVSSGQQAVCLHTTWQVQQPSANNWRVAGRILTTDPPGWFIASQDADIRRDDQTPTSAWQAGQRGDAFNLLRFPQGTPPGDYILRIGIYSARTPDGLDRLVNGVPSGRATELAVIQPVGTTGTPGLITAQTGALPVADTVQLAAHDARGGALSPGQELRITLYWQAAGGCCAGGAWTGAALRLSGEEWELVQPVAAYSGYSLDWHAFVIPANASGTATLTLEPETGEPVVLATYMIEKTDRLFAPPPFAVPVQAAFTQLAVLEGFSVGQTTVTPDETLELTLVWRATATPGRSYVVFTHLLDAGGQVIAQHDGIPAETARPTPGWVSGEYIVDRHVLSFIRQDYRGPARLEVGFYNPETNYRVTLSSGADYLILPIEITVQ